MSTTVFAQAMLNIICRRPEVISPASWTCTVAVLQALVALLQSASSDAADMQPSVDADGAAVAVPLPAALHVSAAASSSRVSGVMGLDQKVSFVLFFFSRYALANLTVFEFLCLGEQ